MPSYTQFYNTATAAPQPYFYQPSTAVVKSEINDFAIKTESLADQILAQKSAHSYQGPIVIRDHHYYHPSSYWWPTYQPSPRVVVINNNGTTSPSPSSSYNMAASAAHTYGTRGRSSKKEKNDNEFALLALAATAAVVSGVAIYALGSSISAHHDAGNECNETKEFQDKLAFYQYNVPENVQGLVYEASKAANLKQRICSRIKNSALANIVLRTGTLASALTLTAGGVLASGILNNYKGVAATTLASAIQSSETILTIGTIAAVVSVGGLLFKWGFDSSDKANERDAQSLKNSVQVLRRS